ncbi:Hypothetical predicted protein [Pelobates cultripes]|uniref:Uncharacterized protein n=1 Tax=Pelobates cultripes TaxID=61616 RepID=A0AAD1WFA7_PELCU|nr:Hypothetical predicted protein [Pelobates cultripes]
MGGTKKKRDQTPSVVTLFQTPKDRQRPSSPRGHMDSGSEIKGDNGRANPHTPLTKGDLRQLLQEATNKIKAYTAAELDKHITSLRTDIEPLVARTHKTETHLAKITSRSRSTTKNFLTYMTKYSS